MTYQLKGKILKGKIKKKKAMTKLQERKFLKS